MFKKLLKTCLFFCFSAGIYLLLISENPETEKLSIGMNLNSYNYYTEALLFNDVMKSAREMFTYNVNGGGEFNTEKIDKILRDPQGYPLELPVEVDGGPAQGIRFLINDYYKGKYIVTYDGEGELKFNGPKESKQAGKFVIYLDGKGTNTWFEIKRSIKGNHIRNIKILPEGGLPDSELFNSHFLEGIKEFHCLRFMDFMMINNSPQTTWESRSQPNYFTQGAENGVAIEYAIQLCNLLNCNPWFCVPHKADDNFIRKYAELVRDTLNPNLKIYLEYSNEIWNWAFPQSHYVLENAPNANDSYVTEALKTIDGFPEKDAYMMQRTFKIWSEVFNHDRQRLVRVAAVQHAWTGNTARILEYLFKTDQNGKPVQGKTYNESLGEGCDAVSPAGYFGYSEANKKLWIGLDPSEVTPEVILEGVKEDYNKESGLWTLETAKYAKAWKIDFVVYEGGQHITPFEQKESSYNESIWNCQINPLMYEMYQTLFKRHMSPEVDCKLFCAYSYVSPRKAIWGSWGHLEYLDQLNDINNIKTLAPKYSALIDVNMPKE